MSFAFNDPAGIAKALAEPTKPSKTMESARWW
jgi:hypothetical protein